MSELDKIPEIVKNGINGGNSLFDLKHVQTATKMAGKIAINRMVIGRAKQLAHDFFNIRGVAVGGGKHGIYSGSGMNGKRNIY